MKKIFLILIFVLCTTGLWASGSGESSLEKEGRSRVFASNYPLYYLCERLAGDYIDLIWPYTDGEDPAFWEPEDEQIRELQGADLLIINGAGYEKWLEYSFIDPNLISDSSSGFKEDFIVDEGGTSHSHGGGAVHDHGGTAFTLWLDLELYAAQAESVYESLVKLLPDKKEIIKQRYDDLIQDLRALDQSFSDAGLEFTAQPVLASHPIYQYFSRAYTGDVHALTLEPDLIPSQDDLNTLEKLKKDLKTSIMIWEGEPRKETQDILQEMEIRWVVISPGFNKPSQGDFLDILDKNLLEFKRIKELMK